MLNYIEIYRNEDKKLHDNNLDYRGEIGVILVNTSTENVTIHPGERIAQAVLSKVYQADFNIVKELSSTQRGEDGFGSTGK